MRRVRPLPGKEERNGRSVQTTTRLKHARRLASRNRGPWARVGNDYNYDWPTPTIVPYKRDTHAYIRDTAWIPLLTRAAVNCKMAMAFLCSSDPCLTGWLAGLVDHHYSLHHKIWCPAEMKKAIVCLFFSGITSIFSALLEECDGGEPFYAGFCRKHKSSFSSRGLCCLCDAITSLSSAAAQRPQVCFLESFTRISVSGQFGVEEMARL